MALCPGPSYPGEKLSHHVAEGHMRQGAKVDYQKF